MKTPLLVWRLTRMMIKVLGKGLEHLPVNLFPYPRTWRGRNGIIGKELKVQLPGAWGMMQWVGFCAKSPWLSKLQGPHFKTWLKSNSIWNLNWKRFDPTSTICNLVFIPHALCIVFMVALLLKTLHVRNLPMRLKLQLSISGNLPPSDIAITSSSTVVNFIFSKPSITLSAIRKRVKKKKKKIQAYRVNLKEGGTRLKKAREKTPTRRRVTKLN